MSLVDELRQMEQQVNRRLQELEPLVAEYNELRGIVERLGGQTTSASPAAKKANGSTRSRATRRTRRAPAAKRGSAAKTAAVTKPAPATKATTRTRAARASSNGARGGKRDTEIIRIVSESPGITVAEVGKRLKVDPTGLYRVVRRLESAGQIKKSGTGLTPAAAK